MSKVQITNKLFSQSLTKQLRAASNQTQKCSLGFRKSLHNSLENLHFSHLGGIGVEKFECESQCESEKQNESDRSSLQALTLTLALFCTRSRGRTGTVLLPLVFETSASTSSAIRALIILV
jgi:hypothetical protein